jgi:ABC-type transport system involved in multi-copper enzyme maturation permease subunit
VLFVSLVGVWIAKIPDDPATITRNDLARIGAAFFIAIAGTQLGLVLLAAPAYTAGAICMDRARGILAAMLVTDLSCLEIVMGKLSARLVPVLGHVLATLPILALAMLLGGIDPLTVAGSVLVTVAVALFGCSLALVISIWGNRAHEVMLVTYLTLAVLSLALPLWLWDPADWGLGPAPSWLEQTNPFWLAFAPYLSQSSVSMSSYFWFFVGSVVQCCLLTVLGALTLRATALPTNERVRRSRSTWLRWPRFNFLLDLNPVLWREWHRGASSRWMRVVWGLYFGGSLVATWFALSEHEGARPEKIALVNAFQFAIGLLLVSVSSVTTLFEERVRGSLDILLVTPLLTSDIVSGKWLGSYRVVLWASLLPSVVGCYLVAGNNADGDGIFVMLMFFLMLTYGAAVNSLGLALATWVPRFGMAIGLSVVIYLFVSGGIVVAGFFPGPRMTNDMIEGMLCASPWFGVGHATANLAVHRLARDSLGLGWKLFWWISYSGVATVLTAATVQTFDGCLGRTAPQSRVHTLSPRHHNSR